MPPGRSARRSLRELIERDPGSVALVSVMWANNEVGTVQPIAELAAVAREYQHPVAQ
jgi:cysteine desulfurase